MSTKAKPLRDASPVHQVLDNCLILRDGRVAMGFELHNPEMESWNGEAYELALGTFQSALRPLPAGSVLQKTDVYYERPYLHPTKPGAYIDQRRANFHNGSLVLFHKSYLFLSIPPQKQAKQQPKRVNALNALINQATGALLPDNPFPGIQLALEQIERVGAELVQSLRSLPGLELERLQDERLQLLLNQFFNLDFAGKPTAPEREILNEGGVVSVGEKQVNIVSLGGQGTETYSHVTNSYGVASPLVYPLTHFLHAPHILTQSMYVHDTREQLKGFTRDKKLNSSLSTFATADNHLRVAELEEMEAEAIADNKLLVDMHLSVLLWDGDAERRTEAVQKTTAAIRAMLGAEPVVESHLTLPLLMATIPGNGAQLPERWLPTLADRACCYWHWTTTYRSTRVGEYLADRSRNLLKVNLFDTNQDNQNTLTIGPSGSGKSFTMGNFIAQRKENGARQIIIDVGGTYEGLVRSLTGNDFENCYFKYDPQNPIEFNPFYMPRDPETNRWKLGDDKLNFLLELLQAIWKGAGNGGKEETLDKAERTLLTRFLRGFYADLNKDAQLARQGERFPGMQTFVEFVQKYHERMEAPAPTDAPTTELAEREQYRKDMQFINMNEFFLVLSEYCKGGRYEKVLNAQRDRDLSEYPLIVFDMINIKTDPTLYPVVAMLITELAMDLFRKYPRDIKYILMDEAWSMMSGGLKNFIELMYRTIRKLNGSIGIITQGIQEIMNSPIGGAIINNTSTRIILNHASVPAVLPQLQQALSFTSHDIDLIKSLRKANGPGGSYREFFIKQGDRGRVYTLEVSPELAAILSSTPTDRDYLQALVELYQYEERVPERDENGKLVLNDDGTQRFVMRKVPRLAPAVDEFVLRKKAGLVTQGSIPTSLELTAPLGEAVLA
ncbi:type IV secretion system DNA-binding domain-containing protein [Hymenobacter sp. NST-14]|uniref:VirB4 family type IV secretion system protein n=1 Tax=Hymenobacter piscis TaxID=2839984 RepID=UPI001C035F80|nr:type IV secretion system DNA-binding domain-containing protein [Hymenobacter piscis]MBT9394393.1 type IV secretion system DNA-binding domain-containing protein [Hymenobacter piscis]